MYAYEGMKLIGAHIVEAVQNGNNEHARAAKLPWAVYLRFCLGPVNTAGVHALSYPLGSLYHSLPHGLSNALCFPM